MICALSEFYQQLLLIPVSPHFIKKVLKGNVKEVMYSRYANRPVQSDEAFRRLPIFRICGELSNGRFQTRERARYTE